ncbi:MAG: efflux RND transporter periplasmic adaptor subunit [Ferruginibacter sp.]
MMKRINYIRIIIFLGAFYMLSCNSKKEKETATATGTRMPEHYPKQDSLTTDIPLDALLKPTNEYVITSVPVTTLEPIYEAIEVPALGTVQYDYRQAGTVAASIAGRIEKLYVRYRYQFVNKGQKVLDIYSPELVTSQQNYIYLLQNDGQNTSLINAARQRLLLLGMTGGQLSQVAKTGKPQYSVSVYSKYSGYVTDIASQGMSPNTLDGNGISGNNNFQQTTEELSIKEGAYVDAGQTIFNVINTNTVIVALSIMPGGQNLIKVGDRVVIQPETTADKISTVIAFIEPSFSGETRALMARAYINNTSVKIPIGSQVQATIYPKQKTANWLPAGAVLSLGLNDIVFKKEGPFFRAYKITTGMRQNDKVQVLTGLTITDTIAANAQYLTDNESFIQVKQ